MNDDTPLLQLKNLGPCSIEILWAVGITTRGELEETGGVNAWLKVNRSGANVSLSLLWAMAGALSDCHWAIVARYERTTLLLQLDAMQQKEE